VQPVIASLRDEPWSFVLSSSGEYEALWPLLWALIFIPIATSLLMANIWIRHRWRLVLLMSWTLSIINSILWVNFNSDMFYPFIAWGLMLGLVDPFVDIGSFQRDTRPWWKKTLAFIGADLHHAGALQLFGSIVHSCTALRQHSMLGLDPADPFGSQFGCLSQLDFVVVMTLFLEATDWAISCTTLYRRAPLWFHMAEPAVMSCQVVLLVVMMLTHEYRIMRISLAATVVGQVFECCFIFTGFKRSTWELVPSRSPRGITRGTARQTSVARQMHRSSSASPDYAEEGLAEVVVPFSLKRKVFRMMSTFYKDDEAYARQASEQPTIAQEADASYEGQTGVVLMGGKVLHTASTLVTTNL
jgi:hypothetical protein